MDSGSGAGGASALTTLRSLLGHLPKSTDFTLQRMTFAPDRFDLTGELKNYEVIDGLSTPLRAAGYSVPAPQARRLTDHSWSFTLQG